MSNIFYLSVFTNAMCGIISLLLAPIMSVEGSSMSAKVAALSLYIMLTFGTGCTIYLAQKSLEDNS